MTVLMLTVFETEIELQVENYKLHENETNIFDFQFFVGRRTVNRQ